MYLLTIGIQRLVFNEEVRETLGYYQSGYFEYMLDDLGYPPDLEKAEKIVEAMPLDMKIIMKIQYGLPQIIFQILLPLVFK